MNVFEWETVKLKQTVGAIQLMVSSSRYMSLMRPERGYYWPVYTADTVSTQRENALCFPGKRTENRRSYNKRLALTVSPTWNVIMTPFRCDCAAVNFFT